MARSLTDCLALNKSGRRMQEVIALPYPEVAKAIGANLDRMEACTAIMQATRPTDGAHLAAASSFEDAAQLALQYRAREQYIRSN